MKTPRFLRKSKNRLNTSLGGMRKGGESPQGFESFHSDLTRARWHNLVCVECL